MRRETFAEALGRFNAAVPFLPFTVELLNGVRLVARHPEAIVLHDDLAVYVETDFTT